MDFQNDQINEALLPDIEALEYRGLEKDYKNLMLIYVSVFNAIFITAFVLFFSLDPFNLPELVYLALGLLLGIRVIWSYLSVIKGFQFKSYALRNNDILYKSGWLWRQTIVIPFNRVQHVQIDQGPLERRFELAKLKVYTAGGSNSDISIPGLRPERADKIKQFIVSKTALDEEE